MPRNAPDRSQLVFAGDEAVFHPKTKTKVDSRLESWAPWVVIAAALLIVLATIAGGGWDTGSTLAVVALAFFVPTTILGRRAQRRNPRPTGPVTIPADLLEALRASTADSERVTRIKLIRDRTRLGLADAVMVDRLVHDDQADQPTTTP